MAPKTDQADDKRQAAREVIDILQEISDLLVRASFLCSPRPRQSGLSCSHTIHPELREREYTDRLILIEHQSRPDGVIALCVSD
jgi:hypothetical protein